MSSFDVFIFGVTEWRKSSMMIISTSFTPNLSKLAFLVVFVCTLQGKCDSLSYALKYDIWKTLNSFGHGMTEKFCVDNFYKFIIKPSKTGFSSIICVYFTKKIWYLSYVLKCDFYKTFNHLGHGMTEFWIQKGFMHKHYEIPWNWQETTFKKYFNDQRVKSWQIMFQIIALWFSGDVLVLFKKILK